AVDGEFHEAIDESSDVIQHAREREVEKAIVAFSRGGTHHEVLLLLKSVLDTPSTSIPPDHPLDHVDELLPVYLLTVGVAGGSSRTPLSRMCPRLHPKLSACVLRSPLALDVREQPRKRHPPARFTVYILEFPVTAHFLPHF